MFDVLEHYNSTITNICEFGEEDPAFRSWLQANYLGRRTLFDEHCTKETFVDLLCTLTVESLTGWYQPGDSHPYATDFHSVLYILLRTKPDVWSN
jgi:hypothetical protein